MASAIVDYSGSLSDSFALESVNNTPSVFDCSVDCYVELIITVDADSVRLGDTDSKCNNPL